MKGLVANCSPRLGAPLIAVAAAAAVAGAAPAAEATFPGKRGPIAFQRIVDPRDEQSSQIFSVARPGARARRLTRGGNGFDPDYSPDGRRIAFERRFGGVMPDTIFTMGADGSAAVRLRRARRTLAWAPALPPGHPTGTGLYSSARSDRSSRTTPQRSIS
jgi:hypothetical protein